MSWYKEDRGWGLWMTWTMPGVECVEINGTDVAAPR